MSLVYHILNKVPGIYADETEQEYEALAQKISDSGLLRIDTDFYCNFVRYENARLKISLAFSKIEVFDKETILKTKERIKAAHAATGRNITEHELSNIIKKLQTQFDQLIPVDKQLSLMLARLFVQSAHPIVIWWLLRDRVEIFLTYGQSIGDIMDVSSWKISGQNSGMQSTDGINVCIYVSCGGNPFAPNNQERPTSGDGWASVARMQIIAAQEIGHFADIMRNKDGKQIGRHSANFSCTRPTPHVKRARNNDVNRCREILQTLRKYGLSKLIKKEEDLLFYRKAKIWGIRVWFIQLYILFYRYKILKLSYMPKLGFIKFFAQEKYLGRIIELMILDMLANLTPEADVYKRNDKDSQEAIACVEALARVPQQCIKWGYTTTRFCMHDLYKVYFNEVIPSLIKNYEVLSSKKYRRNFKFPHNSWRHKFYKIFKWKEQKIQLTPVRDIE